MEKYVQYNGNTFRFCGQYYKRHITIFLHRQVWEDHYGPIPKGFHIHHKDGNKLNNSIENLECLEMSAHHRRTWEDDDGKQREIARKNIRKAIAWRSKPEAKPILSAKSKKAWLKRDPKECLCHWCGSMFYSRMSKLAKWCSKKCCKAFHYVKEKNHDMAY